MNESNFRMIRRADRAPAATLTVPERGPRFGPALAAITAAVLAISPLVAMAGPVTTLDADAHAKVANDEMLVTLSADRTGNSVGPLNEAVLQELNSAIAQARKTTSVKARLAGVYTNPNYNSQGKPSGYRVVGRIELVSGDFAALSALAGDLGQKLQLGEVTFRITLERRRQEEQKLMKAAAEAFRAKAQSAAQAFDFKGYEIKTLTIGTSSVMPMMRAQPMAFDSASAKSASPLPTEAGESDVSVSVGGTVELR